jgi:ubiquinone/menaquinone biosynthesis C-methylase UbiE
MADGHEQTIEQSFSQQAATFADTRFNRVLTTGSDWVFASLPLSGDDVVLDVAAGTGIAARGLAPAVRAVIALDATVAMLEVGRGQAAQDGLTNVVFLRGEATSLPFLDASFPVVVCRYALHHFTSPAAAVAEIARVLVADTGRLAVADLVADDDPEVAARQNELERRRDPSHARALPTDELTGLVREQGLEILNVETRSLRRRLAPWMEQTETSATERAAIERALEDELDGVGPRTGFEPQRDAGDFTFVQTLTSVVARTA